METKKYKRWTQEEIDILQELLLKHGYAEGCKKASIKLNRVEQACKSCVEYRKLKSKNSLRKCNPEELKKVLKKNISENPNNLGRAFKKTAEKLNISTSQVINKWYGIHPYKEALKDTIGTCFMTIGKNYTVNSKNTNENKKTGIWTKIKKLFKLK